MTYQCPCQMGAIEDILAEKLWKNVNELYQLQGRKLWWNRESEVITPSFSGTECVQLTETEERQFRLGRVRTIRRQFDEVTRTLTINLMYMDSISSFLGWIERDLEVGFIQEVWDSPEMSSDDAYFQDYESDDLICDYSMTDRRTFREVIPHENFERLTIKIANSWRRQRIPLWYTPRIEHVAKSSFNPEIPCGDSPIDRVNEYEWLDDGQEVPFSFGEVQIDRRRLYDDGHLTGDDLLAELEDKQKVMSRSNRV